MKKMKKMLAVMCALCLSSNLMFAADVKTEQSFAPNKEATDITAQKNAEVLQYLDFTDKQAFEDAQRGFIETYPDLDIKDATGRSVWNLKDYAFLNKEEAPASANPSLWRQARINMFNGLFKVTDGIYQIREFDMANMTIIEGNTGLIIIDPLGSTESSKLGLELYFKNRPKRDIKAVIHTHSHIDHYGGVKGVINEADVKSGKVKLIAPEGFFEAAISENVYAGNAMGRRTYYHTGALLKKDEKGQIDDGLGKSGAIGTHTIIEPNTIIKKTGEKMTIDGVEIIFLMAPGTEAPAEMLMYFPKFKALCAAEDCTHTLHNLYTLRGAEVRDAKVWWQTLNTAIEMFGKDVNVMFAQHHWPTWDNNRVVEMLASQRDMYKYMHDHTLNLINKGYTMLEVGEMVKLPESLDKKFYNRGYYGSINHDAKAIYQKYIGFYSGNPSDLYQLTPEDAAKKYVEYMGGSKKIIKQAKKDFKDGNYRWVAQVMNQVVFAEPDNKEAKELVADALEQLGYQAESGTWRNNFLVGAFELRNGVLKIESGGAASPDTIKGMSTEMLLDFMGIRLDINKAAGKTILLNLSVQDSKEKYAVSMQNCALVYTKGKQLDKADVTLTFDSRVSFAEVVAGFVTYADQVKAGKIKVSGDTQKAADLFDMQEIFDKNFNIVTP